ncbi:MAG: NAD-dependent epimerase/dehydratase family protein [bacterium]
MTILITGVAGFIGSHVAQALLARGERVIGVDNLNDYYSPALKQQRLARLVTQERFAFHQLDIADAPALMAISDEVDRIIHLAAQAGVRYSIENPQAYVQSNLVGTSNILELARRLNVTHTVYASSSSVYGGNTKTPFCETDMTDDPVSFYGATKKSNELLANSYARLYKLSLTGLRFFTVHGPMGRPDMAYWLFADAIRSGRPIHIFNQGQMGRDFTYIDDIVCGVVAALDRPASGLGLEVPHRVYNLGNDQPEELMTLVAAVERGMGQAAEKIYEPMQQGDVARTWADIARARKELDYSPTISLEEGVARFCHWFQSEWTA